MSDAASAEHRRAALVVAGPLSAVKEQVSAVYARRLREAGYVVLAFDYRGFGSSDGSPRQRLCPPEQVEDLHNAVSFLANCQQVDPQRIGALDICMGGGMVVRLAAYDRRVKAVASVASGFNSTDTLISIMGRDAHEKALKGLSEGRTAEFTETHPRYMPLVAPNNGPAMMQGDEPYAYSHAWDGTPGSTWKNQITVDSGRSRAAWWNGCDGSCCRRGKVPESVGFAADGRQRPPRATVGQ